MESSSSSSCVVCSIQVGFFRGKKKCRICNEVVCRKCSSSDHYSEFYRNFITLCAHCKSKAEELSKRSELDRESPPEKVYYKTRSICAKCFLLDNPGTLSYRDGKVFQRDGKVLLEVKCDKHGTWTTLLSSDVDLFERIWRTGNSSDSKINDVEDLVDSPESPKVSPKKTNPLFVEVDLWNNKSQVFVDDAEVIAKIETLTSWKRHNSDRSDHFVLKLNGGALATRKLLKDFNAKILSLEKRLPSGPILLELPFDRLSDLCILDDSVLIKGRMFPCVRYFLKYGEEAVFKREISHLVNSLRLYPTIQLTMILAVDEPYPCFAPVLEFLKNHKRMARCLIISRQRSTRAIFDNLSKLAEPEDSNAVTELDPYGNDIARLLRQIQEDSNGSIRVQGNIGCSHCSLRNP